MIKKEILATEYSFFRFPNIHLIMLLPIIPSIIIILSQPNLYVINEETIFITANEIREGILHDFILYFEIILTILTGFILVYRWSQNRQDGSYGYWITQQVDPIKYIITVIVMYATLISIAEISGILAIMIYLGLELSFVQYMGLTIGIILSNLLFSSLALIFADFIPRPEVAGLSFVSVTIFNIIVNTNEDSLLYRIFKLENTFLNQGYFLSLFFELILVLVVIGIIIYTRQYKDIKL